MVEYTYWKAPANGNFNTVANWTGGQVPGAAYAVFLAEEESDYSGPAYTVTATTNENVFDLAINKNATLAITGRSNAQATFVADSLQNEGTIKIGSVHGSVGGTLDIQSDPDIYGALGNYDDGVIIINPGGTLDSAVPVFADEYVTNPNIHSTIVVLGTFIGNLAGSTGKFRIDGGVANIGRDYAGAVTFYGTGGGTLEIGIDSFKNRQANIVGFSQTGATILIIDGAGADTVQFTGTASVGYLNLYSGGASLGKYVRLNGNYLNATFTTHDVNGNLVITANAKTASAAALFSQTAAIIGAGAAAPVAAVASVHSTPPALLATNTHAL